MKGGVAGWRWKCLTVAIPAALLLAARLHAHVISGEPVKRDAGPSQDSSSAGASVENPSLPQLASEVCRAERHSNAAVRGARP